VTYSHSTAVSASSKLCCHTILLYTLFAMNKKISQ